MYIQVFLLNGFKKPLTYKIPSDWNVLPEEGSIVQVPIQQRIEYALVDKLMKHPPFVPIAIKEANSLETIPHDPLYHTFVERLSRYYALTPRFFYKRISGFLHTQAETKDADQHVNAEGRPVTLTQEQQAVIDNIVPHLSTGIFYPCLIQGVTGSGKTEVYKKLIEQIFAQGKTTILLLPEVSLAVQFFHIFRKTYPHMPIFGFHSATSVTEKRTLWQTIIAQQPCLIIGVHLPILLPLGNLGLIIIDEEHDAGFQEKKHPKLHSKEIALMRAQLYKVPIVLGSATPSIHTLYHANQKQWPIYRLTHRYAGTFPQVKVVNLKEQDKRRASFWISPPLESEIRQTLARNEQVILFLNRRGYSFFIQCKKCGHIPHCIACSVSLTVHHDKLLCHYCSYEQAMLFSCPTCKAPEGELLKKGIGTQQVVTILEKLFPQARIARSDLDTTVNKKKWNKTITDFEAGNLDILVGTQTVTKGYHFPQVTLVGVLWADINLGLPVYHAAETTLQQLIQVAGRAGRFHSHSTVIIQTFTEHPLFKFLHEIDYMDFYAYELDKRQQVSYPPIVRLAELELKHTNEHELHQEANTLYAILQERVDQRQLPITLLGPAQPPVYQIKDVFIRKIYLKSVSIDTLLQLYHTIDHTQFLMRIYLTQNPLGL